MKNEHENCRKNVEKILGLIFLSFVVKNELNQITLVQPTKEKQDLVITIQHDDEKQGLAGKTFDFFGSYQVGFSQGSTASILVFPIIPVL